MRQANSRHLRAGVSIHQHPRQVDECDRLRMVTGLISKIVEAGAALADNKA